MTGTGQAQVGDERRTGAAGQATVRLAIIDSDTGFLQVLGKRLEGMGWQYRVLASPVPLDAMVALRLNALSVPPGSSTWLLRAAGRWRRACASLRPST